MKSAALLATAVLYGAEQASAVTADFGEKELLQLREEIRDLMKSGAGLNRDSDLAGPFDQFFGNDLPLIASSVRLAFHDCSGEEPTKCNGCLDLDSKANGGIQETAIEPLEPICSEYLTNYELSRADCWALAATFGLELSSELAEESWDYRVNELFDADLKKKDFPKGVSPTGSIDYYLGRVDCSTSPSLEDGFQEEFPIPVNSWEMTREYFNVRFGFTDQEIIALVVGGHSLGRLHSGVAPIGAGPWDASPDVIDNEYAKALLGEPSILAPFNWQYGRYITDGPGPQTFFIENDDFLTYSYCADEEPSSSGSGSSSSDSSSSRRMRRLLGSSSSSEEDTCLNEVFPFLVNKGFVMLDADFNLAYDTTFYTVGAPRGSPIPCRPLAEHYCEANEPGTRVLYPGESIDDYPGETACSQVQCPLKCDVDAATRAGYADNNYEDVSTGCPYAYLQQFALDEDTFGTVFNGAYEKMITAGYATSGDCFDSSSSDSSSSRRRLSETEETICRVTADIASSDSSSS